MTNKEELKKIRKIVTAYHKLTWEDANYTVSNMAANPRRVLEHIDILMALDVPFNYVIPSDFSVKTGDKVSRYYTNNNTTTHYQFDDKTYYVQWSNGNIGPYQFCTETYYGVALPIFHQFKQRLRSYNPVDEDPLNDYMVFTVEDGKRLMNDYKQICEETKTAIAEACKQERIKRMQAELEQLQNEK